MNITKSDAIRESVKELGLGAKNREIQTFCQTNYGFKPTTQHIYHVLGHHNERALSSISGKQLYELKKVCKNTFENNYDLLVQGAIALKNVES
ncbi:MAG: hypothetical protein COA78_17300 [Blastopirellula sp.]|nr:MAG: hypothetical protein COA78_17300 [Blastopirellula sp.]